MLQNLRSQCVRRCILIPQTYHKNRSFFHMMQLQKFQNLFGQRLGHLFMKIIVLLRQPWCFQCQVPPHRLPHDSCTFLGFHDHLTDPDPFLLLFPLVNFYPADLHSFFLKPLLFFQCQIRSDTGPFLVIFYHKSPHLKLIFINNFRQKKKNYVLTSHELFAKI